MKFKIPLPKIESMYKKTPSNRTLFVLTLQGRRNVFYLGGAKNIIYPSSNQYIPHQSGVNSAGASGNFRGFYSLTYIYPNLKQKIPGES